MTRFLKLALVLLSVSSSAWAEPATIVIWPGAEGRKVEDTIDEGGRVIDVREATLVPMLLPASDKPRPAVIICPGGGYRRLVIEKEGFKIARWFNERGFNAFILKYRLSPPEALLDARRAVRSVRSRAQEFGVRPDQIGVVGFSAGGHLVGNLAVHFEGSDAKDETDKMSARPDFVVGVYGVYERRLSAQGEAVRLADAVTRETPPFFLTHAVNDEMVPATNSLNMFAALLGKGVPTELHIYEKGGHGFALNEDRGEAVSWGERCIGWLKGRGIAP